MFSNVRNEDEIAFILSHEAGHQIARHILQTQQNQQLGALILGSAAASLGADVNEAARLGSFLGTRVYSQEFELEADRIGTILAHRAGYNPRIGALSFNRFGGKGGILSTHPASQRRIQTVNATMKQLEGR
jgi:predicted Zn-dependent protease